MQFDKPAARSQPADNEELLFAELRDSFLSDGVEQCRRLIALLDGGEPHKHAQQVHQVLHDWAGAGGMIGCSEISQQAYDLNKVLAADGAEAVREGLRQLSRAFDEAVRRRPHRPSEPA